MTTGEGSSGHVHTVRRCMYLYMHPTRAPDASCAHAEGLRVSAICALSLFLVGPYGVLNEQRLLLQKSDLLSPVVTAGTGVSSRQCGRHVRSTAIPPCSPKAVVCPWSMHQPADDFRAMAHTFPPHWLLVPLLIFSCLSTSTLRSASASTSGTGSSTSACACACACASAHAHACRSLPIHA